MSATAAKETFRLYPAIVAAAETAHDLDEVLEITLDSIPADEVRNVLRSLLRARVSGVLSSGRRRPRRAAPIHTRWESAQRWERDKATERILGSWVPLAGGKRLGECTRSDLAQLIQDRREAIAADMSQLQRLIELAKVMDETGAECIAGIRPEQLLEIFDA